MSIDEAVSLWTDDGVYDAIPGRPLVGREQIAAMLDSRIHRSVVDAGCAHVMSLPIVKIDGDTAVGLGYHRLFVNDGTGHRVTRLTASRWDWERRDGRWQAVKRTHRLLDGNGDQGAEARELLHSTLREISTP